MEQHTNGDDVPFGLLSWREIELALAACFHGALDPRQLGDHTRPERIDHLAIEQIDRLAEELLHASRGLLCGRGVHGVELIVVRDVCDEQDGPASGRFVGGDRGDLRQQVRREFRRVRVVLGDLIFDRPCVLGPAMRIPEQTAAEHCQNRGVDCGIDGFRRGWLLLDDLPRNLGHRGRLKGLPAGGHLVHHHARGPDVAADVRGRRGDLLWRQICDAARIVALLLIGHRRAVFPRYEVRTVEAGQSQLPARHQEHRVAVHVAVDESFRVDELQRVRQLVRHAEELIALHGMGADAPADRFALDEVHDHQQDVAGERDVLNRNDERVVERRILPDVV